MSFTPTVHRFELMELRTFNLLLTEEAFLNKVADMLGKLTAERDQLRQDVSMLEHRVRQLENP